MLQALQMFRTAGKYRDIEEIRQEIQIVMQSFKFAEASASNDEGCDGERED